MSKVMEKANELGEVLKQDERFLVYQAKKEQHDNDLELKKMISEFNLTRMNLDSEMKKDDRDDEKVQSIQKTLEQQYKIIMDNKNMKEFMMAREDLEEIVNNIYGTINYHITGEQQGCDDSKCESCGGGCEH